MILSPLVLPQSDKTFLIWLLNSLHYLGLQERVEVAAVLLDDKGDRQWTGPVSSLISQREVSKGVIGARELKRMG
jgi:hypothetical protein